jgi:hypothetical protein
VYGKELDLAIADATADLRKSMNEPKSSNSARANLQRYRIVEKEQME